MGAKFDTYTQASDNVDEEKKMDDVDNGGSSNKNRMFINCICPGWVRTDMGGMGATRAVDEGAYGAVRLATLEMSEKFPNGCFFRDDKELSFNTGNAKL